VFLFVFTIRAMGCEIRVSAAQPVWGFYKTLKVRDKKLAGVAKGADRKSD